MFNIRNWSNDFRLAVAIACGLVVFLIYIFFFSNLPWSAPHTHLMMKESCGYYQSFNGHREYGCWHPENK